MGHTELTSKADYDAALAQTGKYVLIYAYEGEVHPKAEERSEKHSATTYNYKVDVSKNTAAKDGLKITTVPTVVIFKDGAEVKRVDGVNADSAEEIGQFLSS